MNESIYEFNALITPVLSIDQMNYDAYKFHKKLRALLADADSTLDYLDKLYNELSKNNSAIRFNRKDSEVANNINELRNSYLHEGIPSINTKIRTINSFQPCHANVANFTKSEGYINLTFKVYKGETKDWEVQALLSHIRIGVNRLMMEKTKELTNCFEIK